MAKCHLIWVGSLAKRLLFETASATGIDLCDLILIDSFVHIRCVCRVRVPYGLRFGTIAAIESRQWTAERIVPSPFVRLRSVLVDDVGQ